MFKRINAAIVLFVFLLNTFSGPSGVYAQSVFLPAPGTMVPVSEAFVPLRLQGLTVHFNDPLLFDFIVDTGNSGLKSGPVDNAAIKAESQKLIKYFLASLTISEKDQWVNLSPYEKDRILSESLGKTDLGRDMLAQDYVLKQVTATMIDPNKELGKSFWKRVYARAQAEFGVTDIPMDTFNKVWIVTDKAAVYSHKDPRDANKMTAIVTEAHLKVMLETDYLAMSNEAMSSGLRQPKAEGRGTQELIRAIVLPELEKEVNTGKNFANLRQIHEAVVLATWYKRTLKNALLTQVYADHAKTGGVEGGWLKDKKTDIDPEQVWERYVEAYQKGVFNFIKDDVDQVSGETVPRKYFSGGDQPVPEALREALPSEVRPLVGEVILVTASGQTTPSAAQKTTVKILFADAPAGKEKTVAAVERTLAQVRALFPDAVIEIIQQTGVGEQSPEALAQAIKDTKPTVIIVRSATKMTPAMIDLGVADHNGLRAIVRMGAGYDNIDAGYAASKGVSVIRTHGNANSVADLTLHLLASLSRMDGFPVKAAAVPLTMAWSDIAKTLPAEYVDLIAKSKKWPKGVVPAEQQGVMQAMRQRLVSTDDAVGALAQVLQGRTIGLLGFGPIAQAVAEKLQRVRKATGIEFTVVAATRAFDQQNAERLKEAEALGVLPVSREELFRRANILSLHVPDGVGLEISAEELSYPNILAVINTARGNLVTAAASQEIAKDKYLLGDFDLTPASFKLMQDHPGRVMVLPHVGASTKDAGDGVEENTVMALPEIVQRLLGQAPSGDVAVDIVNGIEIPARDAAMGTLAEEVKRAWEASDVREFVENIHNDYLVDTQKRLEPMARFMARTDPYFTRGIMVPEKLTSQWAEDTLLNARNEPYTADVFYTRSANSSARGVPKGGWRGLFNYIKKSQDGEGQRTASDLMRDPAFERAFSRFNELLRSGSVDVAAKKALAKRFLQRWIEDEARALSLWMSFKTSVIGLPLGGAKGVVFVGQIRINESGMALIEDTTLWNDQHPTNVAEVARHYIRTLYAAGSIGPDIDVPAPDKRTDGVSMGYATDEYILLNLDRIKERDADLYGRLRSRLETEMAGNGGSYPLTSTALVEEETRYLHETGKPAEELAVITGKSPVHGGVLGRPEATGFGVALMIRSLLEAEGVEIQGKTLAIQGAGNVALYLALQAARYGMNVRILGDEEVTLIKKNGFSESEILKLIKHFEDKVNKKKMYQVWEQVVDDVANVTVVRGDGDAKTAAKQRAAAILEADVDVLSPSATEGVLTEKNAPGVKARYIVPGANGPITPEGLRVLEENGVTVVPDTLANARGVMVSFFEQVQALTGHIFTAEEVASIGERIHQAAFAGVWAEHIGRTVSLTVASDVVSAQGIIRAQYLTLIKKFDGDLKKMGAERQRVLNLAQPESEIDLRRQIEASGLAAHLKAIENESLSIRVIGPDQQAELKAASTQADIIIASSSVGQGVVPFFISQGLLRQIGGGKIIIDPMLDQGGVFEDGERHRLATPEQPAWLDAQGNLRFSVKNMPAVFNGVASQRLAAATQGITMALAAGTDGNDAFGLRSGIVIAEGQVLPSGSVTDEAYERVMTTQDGRKRTIGIPKERLSGETRVGATTIEVEELVKKGYVVTVEQGAGAASGISDSDYQRSGAVIVTRREVWQAELIRKVRAPLAEEYGHFRQGMIIEALFFLDLPESQEMKRALIESKVTAVAYEEVKKKGYRPLLDRVFFLEQVGAEEDQGKYILNPMSRSSGSVAALWAALYYRKDAQYQKLVDDQRIIDTSVVVERNLHLKRIFADVQTHMQEFMTHSYEYPRNLLRGAGLDKGIGRVLVLGGTYVGRAAALDTLLLGAQKVEMLVASEQEKALLERQFRSDGLLRVQAHEETVELDPRGQMNASFSPEDFQRLRVIFPGGEERLYTRGADEIMGGPTYYDNEYRMISAARPSLVGGAVQVRVIGNTLALTNMTAQPVKVRVVRDAAGLTSLSAQDQEAAANGGIDLDASKSLTTSGDQADIRFDAVALEKLRRGDFAGITPVIVSMVPVSGLMPILGFEPAGK